MRGEGSHVEQLGELSSDGTNTSQSWGGGQHEGAVAALPGVGPHQISSGERQDLE